jgi:hypothetical protein
MLVPGWSREPARGLAGGIPPGAHAHHVLAQKFEEKFNAAGIIIHDPNYLAWCKEART